MTYTSLAASQTERSSNRSQRPSKHQCESLLSSPFAAAGAYSQVCYICTGAVTVPKVQILDVQMRAQFLPDQKWQVC